MNAKYKDGFTPLMGAVLSGHLDVVKVLVAKGSDVNTRDGAGWSPLMWATAWGEKYPDVVEFLKQHGATK